jgi:hypothetical protein
MTFLSAYEDFVIRTLAGLGGAFEKLAYLRGLRNDAGDYRHWGLSRTFGHEQASAALAQAHTEIWLQVLRTPIPALFTESRKFAVGTRLTDGNGIGPAELDRLTPPNRAGGAQRHFSSILLAVSLLSQEEKEPNQPGA